MYARGIKAEIKAQACIKAEINKIKVASSEIINKYHTNTTGTMVGLNCCNGKFNRHFISSRYQDLTTFHNERSYILMLHYTIHLTG